MNEAKFDKIAGWKNIHKYIGNFSISLSAIDRTRQKLREDMEKLSISILSTAFVELILTKINIPKERIHTFFIFIMMDYMLHHTWKLLLFLSFSLCI